MANRTGLLKNSPLIYALASIRFAPWPLINKKIDEIHDDLRDIVPIIQRLDIQQLGIPSQPNIQNESVNSSRMLMPSDRSFGLQLYQDQLFFVSSKYTKYSEFENVISKALNVLEKYMRFIDVTTLGVRYIDYIKSTNGESLDRFVNPSLLAPSYSGLERTGGGVFGFYKTASSELKVRCISQPNSLAVPEDMIGTLALMLDPTKAQSLQLEKLKINECLLDMDASRLEVIPKRMDSKKILESLNSLHQDANSFFRHDDVCTDYAFNIWRG